MAVNAGLENSCRTIIVTRTPADSATSAVLLGHAHAVRQYLGRRYYLAAILRGKVRCNPLPLVNAPSFVQNQVYVSIRSKRAPARHTDLAT